MNLKTKVKLAIVKRMGFKLAEIQTSTLTLYLLEGDTVEVGSELFAMDESGEYILPPDGQYDYGDDVITLAAGVVTDIGPRLAAEPMSALGFTKPKHKLEADVVTVDEYNGLVDIIEAIVEKLDDAGLDDDGELEMLTVELSEVKTKNASLTDELAKVKVELSRAKQVSARDFADPRNKPDFGDDRGATSKERLSKFGLK